MTTPNPPASTGGGGDSGNVFTRKIGPLPMWGWMGVGLGVVLAYTYWKQDKSSSSSSSSGTSSTAATTTADASQVPQFVNQVYTNNTPPPSSSTTGSSGSGSGGTVPTTSSPLPVDVVNSPLPTPTGHSVTPYTNYADIGWTPVSGATTYHLQVENAAGKLIYNQTVSSTSAKVTGLSTSTGYKYRVSVNGPQPGEWTGWTSFTTKS